MARIFPADQCIVIGGGLAGFSAAHTLLENGCRVLLIDKNPFCGGNSSKATSGINGALTRVQKEQKIADSVDVFIKDTVKGGSKQPELARVLCTESGPAVEWLMDKFGLDLSLVARLGGHSYPRTHRGKEKFPGMTITYALMQAYEKICQNDRRKAVLLNSSRALGLIISDDGKSVIGVRYRGENGLETETYGTVVIATGGFGADFSKDSLLAQFTPHLMNLPTTNGEHCTGDGIKMALDAGAGLIDMECVQVHPTGLVNSEDPDAKIKFLAAEALRGVGGILLDRNGKRFCNELGRRDYVSGRMAVSQAPFYLCLNEPAINKIHWHVEHYVGRGVMKVYDSPFQFTDSVGISSEVLIKTFDEYNTIADKQLKNPEKGTFPAYPDGVSHDPFGKKFYESVPITREGKFAVAVVTRVIHYCMGGVSVNQFAEVKSSKGGVVKGLYCAGEAAGGVHGENRLGGNSLLDCVVYGRIAGISAAKYMFGKNGDFRHFENL